MVLRTTQCLTVAGTNSVPLQTENGFFMNTIQDYTAWTIGKKVDRGEIKVCRHCSRNGLAQEIHGKVFYKHKVLSEPDPSDPKKPLLLDWDFCPRDLSAAETVPAK